MTTLSQAVEARIARNEAWAAKMGKQSPIRVNDIEPNTALIRALWTDAREAFDLLGLINAEFRSDPMSVQCFDLRIVARVRACVKKVEEAQR